MAGSSEPGVARWAALTERQDRRLALPSARHCRHIRNPAPVCRCQCSIAGCSVELPAGGGRRSAAALLLLCKPAPEGRKPTAFSLNDEKDRSTSVPHLADALQAKAWASWLPCWRGGVRSSPMLLTSPEPSQRKSENFFFLKIVTCSASAIELISRVACSVFSPPKCASWQSMDG